MHTQLQEQTYQLPTYEKLPLTIEKGSGCYVWDDKGEKYLDLYGGHAVALVGHNHPHVVKKIKEQLDNLIFYSNIVYNSQRAKAAEKLIGITHGDFAKVFFCNSGTEANEAALKIAKKFTGKKHIVSFINSFHGRTLGSLSVTGISSYHKQEPSLVTDVSFSTLGDITSVLHAITPETAAIIIEPIQSIAGIVEADPDFYINLRNICNNKGIILIFDEVQTGLGRTGEWFFGEHYSIIPDVITLAKGVAGGLPAGAVLVNKTLSDSVSLGDLGSTFGGSPMVTSAITATLETIEKNDLVHNAAVIGDYMKNILATLPHVQHIHGKGLLLGIAFDIPVKNIMQQLFHYHVITGTSANPHVLRLMPPLIITKEEINIFIQALKHVVEAI